MVHDTGASVRIGERPRGLRVAGCNGVAVDRVSPNQVSVLRGKGYRMTTPELTKQVAKREAGDTTPLEGVATVFATSERRPPINVGMTQITKYFDADETPIQTFTGNLDRHGMAWTAYKAADGKVAIWAAPPPPIGT